MIRCLNCQAENADDAVYCANCGFTLAWEGPDRPAPPQDDEPVSEAAKPPDATAGTDATRELPPPPPSRRPSPRALVVPMACVLVALAVVLVVVVAGGGGSPARSAPETGASSPSETATSSSPSGVKATDRGAPFDPVRVHTAPSSSAPRAGSLHKGDTVTLVCGHAGFVKIGNRRWVFAKQFTQTVPECDPGDVDGP